MKKIFIPALIIFNSLFHVAGQVIRFESADDFVLKCGFASIIPHRNVGHGFSKWYDFMPQWNAIYAEMIAKFDSDQSLVNKDAPNKKIPTIITLGKSGVKSNVIAVMFSGDGGWYGLEQSIANHLANSGISTIGIDTRKYFWNRKTPEITASDVESLLNYYGKEWNRSQFMFIGYSQGAEIIPFVINRLPEVLKSKVISSVMLSPEETTDFEVHISNMLGLGNKQNTYDVIAEISRIKKIRQICIFGEKEDTKVPGLLKGKHVEEVFIPGDHHYKSNSTLIVQEMKNKQAF